MTDLVLPHGDEVAGASVEFSGSEGSAQADASQPIHARRWPDEEKARIVEESDRPGAVQKEVAARLARRACVSGAVLRTLVFSPRPRRDGGSGAVGGLWASAWLRPPLAG